MLDRHGEIRSMLHQLRRTILMAEVGRSERKMDVDVLLNSRLGPELLRILVTCRCSRSVCFSAGFSASCGGADCAGQAERGERAKS